MKFSSGEKQFESKLEMINDVNQMKMNKEHIKIRHTGLWKEQEQTLKQTWNYHIEKDNRNPKIKVFNLKSVSWPDLPWRSWTPAVFKRPMNPLKSNAKFWRILDISLFHRFHLKGVKRCLWFLKAKISLLSQNNFLNHYYSIIKKNIKLTHQIH